MGLFTKLLLAPLAPMYGVVALAQELERQAVDELYGEQSIRRALRALEEALDEGRITEDEYDAEEGDLLWRLELARRAEAESA